jgi:hypothetical protein
MSPNTSEAGWTSLTLEQKFSDPVETQVPASKEPMEYVRTSLKSLAGVSNTIGRASDLFIGSGVKQRKPRGIFAPEVLQAMMSRDVSGFRLAYRSTSAISTRCPESSKAVFLPTAARSMRFESIAAISCSLLCLLRPHLVNLVLYIFGLDKLSTVSQVAHPALTWLENRGRVSYSV